jgi:hypothetical protein
MALLLLHLASVNSVQWSRPIKAGVFEMFHLCARGFDGNWPMKFLIQNCHTHNYLRTLNDWTPDADQARDFGTSGKAMHFCSEHQLPAVQIVLKFETDRYDVRLPITEECKEPVAS